MPGRRERPLFLARRSYRRRRMMDAARLLPVVGAVLLLLPVFWRPQLDTVTTGLWLFAAWIGLIGAAFGLARGLAPALDAEEETVSAPEDGA